MFRSTDLRTNGSLEFPIKAPVHVWSSAFTLCHVCTCACVASCRFACVRACLRLQSKVPHCACVLARLPANKRAAACGGHTPERAHTSVSSSPRGSEAMWQGAHAGDAGDAATSAGDGARGMPSVFLQSWWFSWGCSRSFHPVSFYSATLPLTFTSPPLIVF